MRRLLLVFLLLGQALTVAALSPAEAEARARELMDITDEAVREGLSRFDASLIDYRTDEAVVRRVTQYIQDWPINSGRMMARSARLYPIFERQLSAAALPLALKHLSIIESGLRPFATSRVGAGGLWQLMPGTARELGLSINRELDERLDAERGCAAGLEYLRRQYARYGDWALALAAYNCGPGNVNRAIRRSGSRNYWKLRRFLPRETRNYVPYFIAATYVMAFHDRHGLHASPMDPDLQLTETVRVFRRLSLHRVARVTDLRPDVLLELNPQYLRGYLPGYPGGHLLRLPKRTAPALREYLARYPASLPEEAVELPWSDPLLQAAETDATLHYQHYLSSVAEGDSTMRQAALRLGLPVDQLVVWSQRGELDSLRAGDPLAFLQVGTYLRYDRTPREILPAVARLPVTRPGRARSAHGPPRYRRPSPEDLAPASPPPIRRKKMFGQR